MNGQNTSKAWAGASRVIGKTVATTLKGIEKEVSARAYRASNELRTASLYVLRGQRSGRTYRVPLTNKTYTASAPGEPPAVRTGMLRLSWGTHIHVEKKGSHFRAVSAIESGLRAGKHFLGDLLEDGTTRMAPRPYKQAVIDRAMPRIKELYIMGGAKTVHAVRLGTGGTYGSYQIQDGAGAEVIRLLLKYPGSRPFSITIRPTLENLDMGELLLLDDGLLVLERHNFGITSGVNQVDALIAALAAIPSAFFTLTKVADGDGVLETIDQQPVTTGTDPVINVAAYSAAFEALEPHRWNVLAIDTTDPAIQLVMQQYLSRVYESGKFVMGVIGADTSKDLDTRLAYASGFNDYQMVCVGNGFIDSAGTRHEGWLAAARIAGLIAGNPSNESITHLDIIGAAELTEHLTNYQYEQAIKAGLLTFSMSSAGTVWVEQGINTLVLPGTKEDEGWKKIKRVKVRFELFQRLNDTVERLIGRVNNNSDGRMTIVQSCNGVCNAMMTEGKLLPGARCEVDPGNPPIGDSA